MSLISYRPEIDGLRCIAVLGPIGWHAQFNILGHDPVPGGFLGVDIFFVISGYLITLIILRELQIGRFTIRGFYERRARRILPILLTVLLSCLPFAWLFMLPKAVEEFTGSVLSTLALISGSGRKAAIGLKRLNTNRCCTPGRLRSKSSTMCCSHCSLLFFGDLAHVVLFRYSY